jgi:hypothetical protein
LKDSSPTENIYVSSSKLVTKINTSKEFDEIIRKPDSFSAFFFTKRNSPLSLHTLPAFDTVASELFNTLHFYSVDCFTLFFFSYSLS